MADLIRNKCQVCGYVSINPASCGIRTTCGKPKCNELYFSYRFQNLRKIKNSENQKR